MNNISFVSVIIFASLFLWTMSSPSIQNQVLGQTINTTSSNSTTPIDPNTNTEQSLKTAATLQKLESIYALTTVNGISIVDGIKVSGIYIGDNDLTVTLKPVSDQNTATNNTMPVTVIATKLPVANLTQFLTLVQSSKSAAMASSSDSSMDPVIGQSDLSSLMGNNALQVLTLLKNYQIGAASITNADWSVPQTVSMGMLGSQRGSADAETNEIVTVIVVPFLSESSFPSMSLN